MRSSFFYYLIHMNIYTQNLPVCNSGQYTCVAGLCNFFFVLQDLIDRIFVSSTVRTLIFHILPPKTFSLNMSQKVPKICKIVIYFEVSSSRNIFFKEKLRQLEKKKSL